MKLPIGKLDSDLLREIVFDKIKYRSDEVKVRPGIGEDCAVMDFGSCDCIMSTDPISSAVSDIGRLCIHITCNDIASNGVQPLGIMLACMLPEGTTAEDVEQIMEQAAETAAALEVEIIGGHTEITAAVKQPVIVSTAVGRCLSGECQSGDEMEPGDYIMVSKSVGLEGSGIIAADYPDRLELTDGELERARSFLEMTGVVPEGVTAGRVGTHGMHDITEGGILGAVWEMCQISHKGAEVWEEAIPLEPETVKICSQCGIDPFRLISSGSMVIIVPKDRLEKMEKAMAAEGIKATVIGRIMEESEGIYMVSRTVTCGAVGKGRIRTKIDPPYADEIYKVVK